MVLDGVHCKGKFIYLSLDGGEASLWSTLGMTGGWTVRRDQPHARVALRLRGEVEEARLVFYDMRNFGTFRVCFEAAALARKLESLGLSWIEDGASPDFGDRFAAVVHEAVRRSPRRPLAKF